MAPNLTTLVERGTSSSYLHLEELAVQVLYSIMIIELGTSGP